MPIKPENRALYPSDWKAISLRIRGERARWQCEWVEDGQRCQARQGQLHPVTGSKVILTTAHVHNPDPADCRDENLLALCQMHHNRLDAPMRRRNAAETRRQAQGQAGQLTLL